MCMSVASFSALGTILLCAALASSAGVGICHTVGPRDSIADGTTFAGSGAVGPRAFGHTLYSDTNISYGIF